MEFFSGMDGRLLDKIARAGHLRTYRPGEVIVRTGEPGLGMYGILDGRVKVEREVDGVIRQVAELGPPQFFAEIAIIDDKPRSATVTATQDTECLLLTRDSFLALARKYPQLTLRLARVLAERLRATQAELAKYQQGAKQPASVESGASPVVGAPDAGRANGFKTGKARVQQSLVETFQQLYLMKAMVRFSVAVLGCPVEADSTCIIAQERVDETKMFLLPAEASVALDLEAIGTGAFMLHIFTPGSAAPLQFGPLPIQSSDRFQLRLNGSSGTLLKVAGQASSPDVCESSAIFPQPAEPQ